MARSRVSARICAPALSAWPARCSKEAARAKNSPEAVPAQVVLLDQLLHVLGRRAAGAGLEQPAAVHQRHDREHLGRGAELEDREQVGVVVAQHVAGHRDGVLAAADALERVRRRLGRRHDLDRQAVGVVLGQVLLDLGDQVRVVGAGLVEPEHRRGAGGAGAGDGELDPVADRRVLGLAGAPDVAGLDVVLDQHRRRLRRRPAPCRRPGPRRSCRASRTPRPPWPSGPTLGTEPIVAGSKAPWARQSSMTVW